MARGGARPKTAPRSWAAAFSVSLTDPQTQSWAMGQTITSSFDLRNLSRGAPPLKMTPRSKVTLASSLREPRRGPAVSPRSAALVLNAATHRSLGVPTALVAAGGMSGERLAAAYSRGMAAAAVGGGGGAGYDSARSAVTANDTPAIAVGSVRSPRSSHSCTVPAVVPSRGYGATGLRVHPRTACDYAASSPRAEGPSPRGVRRRPATARAAQPGEALKLFTARFPTNADGSRRPVSAFRPRPSLHVTLLPNECSENGEPEEPSLHGHPLLSSVNPHSQLQQQQRLQEHSCYNIPYNGGGGGGGGYSDGGGGFEVPWHSGLLARAGSPVRPPTPALNAITGASCTSATGYECSYVCECSSAAGPGTFLTESSNGAIRAVEISSAGLQQHAAGAPTRPLAQADAYYQGQSHPGERVMA